MSDWLDDAVKKAKEKYDTERIQDEKFVQEQKLKQQLGDGFNRDLHQWLTKNIADFNTKFRFQCLKHGQSARRLSDPKRHPVSQTPQVREFILRKHHPKVYMDCSRYSSDRNPS